VARRASQADLLETMPLEKSLVDGVFKLSVLQPSFDFQHCQSASVELVIPQKLVDKLHLTLKAQTLLGKITVNAPGHLFDKVSLLANLGVVKAEELRAQNSVDAEARFGLVHVGDVKANSAAVRTTFGAACAQAVHVEEAEFNVETGRATLGFVEAKKAKITSEMGWISACRSRPTRSMPASTTAASTSRRTRAGPASSTSRARTAGSTPRTRRRRSRPSLRRTRPP